MDGYVLRRSWMSLRVCKRNKLDNKEVYTKTLNVILFCKTFKQAWRAQKYIHLAEKYLTKEQIDIVWAVWNDHIDELTYYGDKT